MRRMVKHLSYAAAILAVALAPTAAVAGNGNGKANGKNKNSVKVQRVAPQPSAASRALGHCPPGLAKKAVPCVPPGQVKNLYRAGDYITRDFIRINDPYRYGLKRGGYYIRAGDYVYSVDANTHKVLNLVGAVANILY